MPPTPRPADPASEGWRAAKAIGAMAEHVAAMPIDENSARAMLRTAAQQMGLLAAIRQEPSQFASLRATIAARPACAFFDYARDAAASFGDADAATPTFEVMAALIQGIRIIDDIQDEEEVCLAAEVGTGRALTLASGALALALELIAALPLRGASWRAATAAHGRGLRETAHGQELEHAATSSSWELIDRKTAPLVATALEVGALAAGAEPAAASTLTKLAIPLGRLLQIGDDCHDALGPDGSDWRTPHKNLLIAYALSGPHGAELARLPLREAQVALLRDGALAYAMHAHVTTLATLTAALESLALPHPGPFARLAEQQRDEAESLLRRSGVDAELAASLSGGA
jgi:geranylgeranyl pyrophosphate synthase